MWRSNGVAGQKAHKNIWRWSCSYPYRKLLSHFSLALRSWIQCPFPILLSIPRNITTSPSRREFEYHPRHYSLCARARQIANRETPCSNTRQLNEAFRDRGKDDDDITPQDEAHGGAHPGLPLLSQPAQGAGARSPRCVLKRADATLNPLIYVQEEGCKEPELMSPPSFFLEYRPPNPRH